MEVTVVRQEGKVLVRVQGRLDSYWAEHLEEHLDALVRDGEHHLQLILTDVVFLSSAGIRVLLKHARGLREIGGALTVWEPSEPVREVLELSGLGDMLFGTMETEEPPQPPDTQARRMTAGEVTITVGGVPAQASCRLMGSTGALTGPNPGLADLAALQVSRSTLAVGIGAMGASRSEADGRLGEFFAVGGAVACLPTGPAAAPDYMLCTQAFSPTAQVLYAAVCEGDLSLRMEFEPSQPGGEIALSALAAAALKASGSSACMVAIVGETTGLVGAALKRSPGLEADSTAMFAPGQIQHWLTFTPEPVRAGSLAVIAGIATGPEGSTLTEFVRPMGDASAPLGHFHAAALSYRAVPRGITDPSALILELFETQSLEVVLHLLPDARGVSGAGESRLTRGCMWAAPITLAGGVG